jgi:hypothetical protein
MQGERSASEGMAGLRTLLAIATATCAALLLSGCIGEKHTFRYRLTLAVAVDGTMHTGASVIEDTFVDQVALAGLAGGVPWATRLRGEAVAVDLGVRGMLFCVLARDPTRSPAPNAVWLPIHAFNSYFVTGSPATDSADFSAQVKAVLRDKPKRRVDLNELPMLVRFRDINDPGSIERIDPTNLAARFGAGVELVTATIEITDDPVTTGLENVLRWLKSGYPEKWLVDPQREPLNQIPQEKRLTYSDFERSDT